MTNGCIILSVLRIDTGYRKSGKDMRDQQSFLPRKYKSISCRHFSRGRWKWMAQVQGVSGRFYDVILLAGCNILVLEFPYIEEEVGGITLLMFRRSKEILPALLSHMAVAEHQPVALISHCPGVVVTLPTVQTTVHHHILQLVAFLAYHQSVRIVHQSGQLLLALACCIILEPQ